MPGRPPPERRRFELLSALCLRAGAPLELGLANVDFENAVRSKELLFLGSIAPEVLKSEGGRLGTGKNVGVVGRTSGDLALLLLLPCP